MKELIEKFIKENKLDLTETGSALNSTCCIISGYTLYIGITELQELFNIFGLSTSSEFNDELTKVFIFAKKNNYREWWKSEDARKQYIYPRVKNI